MELKGKKGDFDYAQSPKHLPENLRNPNGADRCLNDRSLSGVEGSGYKHTEIGVIPEDWKIKSVRELIELLTDFDANGSFASVADNVNVSDGFGFAWYVRSTDLENNSGENEVKYVDEKSYNFLKKTSLFGNELLFLKRGEIGKVYLFKMKTDYATLAPNLYLLKLNNLTHSKFLFYFFNTASGKSQLIAKNASSTLGALYKDDVKSILVSLPPLPEQQKIAEALSDTDALIQSLKKLIAKKKDIKQGAMQELLTPKEDWGVKKLGSLLLVAKSGGTPLSSVKEYYNGTIPFLSISDMTVQGKYLTKTENKISQRGIDNSSSWLVPANSLIYSMYASVGFVSINKIDIATSQAVLNMIPKNNIDKEFLYYFLVSIQNYVLKFVGEGTQKNLNAQAVKDFEINLPKSKEEQTRIAQILSDMDAEIEALEKQLQKTELLKQGMMQELLTGRIRLIKPQAEKLEMVAESKQNYKTHRP